MFTIKEAYVTEEVLQLKRLLHMSNKNFFVVFEGSDNLGKTTVAEVVCKQLNFQYMKFPNPNLYSGKILREILQGKRPFEPAGFQALNIIDRLLTPMRGHLIIDRYVDSGTIYGESDGLPRAWVDEMNSMLTQPDLVFVFTGTPFATDGEKYDNNEKIVQGYRRLLEENKDNPKYVEINANRPVEEVADEIVSIITARCSND